MEKGDHLAASHESPQPTGEGATRYKLTIFAAAHAARAARACGWRVEHLVLMRGLYRCVRDVGVKRHEP